MTAESEPGRASLRGKLLAANGITYCLVDPIATSQYVNGSERSLIFEAVRSVADF